MCQHYLKLPLFVCVLGLFINFGQRADATGANSEQRLAQVVRACEYGDFPKYYSKVTTNSGDPLVVRQTPAGKAIGSIPDNWAVVVLEWSRNGVWARVTSHFGDVGEHGFASAEDFREGWVAAGYLKDLGRFCDKPDSVAQIVQPELFGTSPVEIQSDWLALGDTIAQSIVPSQDQ
ncbi:MAG: SH3 domain-containing protein [Alkalinema sp. RL_2_19]|nr:SH3 domain-containing protein [Alkalinema sp. RL_2_19]